MILVSVGTTAQQLNALITSAADGEVIVLENGVHVFDAPILIERDDITLKGQSESNTVIQFSFASGQESSAIQINGGSKTYLGVSNQGVTADQTHLTLAPDHGLQAGDVIYLYQANTQTYLNENGWTNVSWDDADQRPFRETVVVVTSVDGDTVQLNHPIPYDMDAGEIKVFTIDAAENITLSDFTVTYDLGTANPYDFVNAAPGFQDTSAIELNQTVGAHLSNITINDAASNGLTLNTTIDLIGDNIAINGSHNKGGGGNGYGVELHESSFNTLSNLDIFDVRHSLVLSAWSAENDNIINIANTNRDINFHGSPDTGNIVTVDNATLDYDQAQNTSGLNGIWSLVSSGGASHAATDIYGENSVVFTHGEASSNNDVIYGADGGAYLNGKFGYDTLVGGAGDDFIVGGTRKDTLTGGDGSDTFLFRMGDDLDTITDFQFGADGDVLIFSANMAVDSFDDLVITQVGDDVRIRYGSNSTVVLQNHDVSDVDAANIQFDPTGTLTAVSYFGIDFDGGI